MLRHHPRDDQARPQHELTLSVRAGFDPTTVGITLHDGKHCSTVLAVPYRGCRRLERPRAGGCAGLQFQGFGVHEVDPTAGPTRHRGKRSSACPQNEGFFGAWRRSEHTSGSLRLVDCDLCRAPFCGPNWWPSGHVHAKMLCRGTVGPESGGQKRSCILLCKLGQTEHPPGAHSRGFRATTTERCRVQNRRCAAQRLQGFFSPRPLGGLPTLRRWGTRAGTESFDRSESLRVAMVERPGSEDWLGTSLERTLPNNVWWGRKAPQSYLQGARLGLRRKHLQS
mmetsp:Transcript_84699/g.177138  ORF Transcript_84699/g.177138 Transcript_84699/m.177138 type:complete len:281 (-) Transcript_84699:1083-1925(-)